jgi:hypothetical protein
MSSATADKRVFLAKAQRRKGILRRNYFRRRKEIVSD